MKVRVLQVLGRSAGGIARHVAHVVAALDGRGDLVVDVAGPPDLPVAMPKPVLPVNVPDGPMWGHRDAVVRLHDVLRRGRYDVLHAHGLRAGIDAGLAGRRARVPVLLTVHNLVQPEIAGAMKAKLYRLAEPLAARLADRTFCVSQEMVRRLRTSPLARDARIEVLYLGVGEAPKVSRGRHEVRAELGLDDASMIVSVSRLSPQKALHVLLDAVAGFEDVALVVLGEGELRGQLEERARRAGLAERVHFLGFRSDVADFVAAADVFCLSSIWEGIPLSVQEAILLGTPVVAPAVGGLPEVVTDGETGRLVPPGDPAALAAGLAEILEDPAQGRRYAARARTELTVRFSTEEMLRRLAHAYRKAAGAG